MGTTAQNVKGLLSSLLAPGPRRAKPRPPGTAGGAERGAARHGRSHGSGQGCPGTPNPPAAMDGGRAGEAGRTELGGRLDLRGGLRYQNPHFQPPAWGQGQRNGARREHGGRSRAEPPRTATRGVERCTVGRSGLSSINPRISQPRALRPFRSRARRPLVQAARTR